MAMFGGSGLPGGFHQDVMDAQPGDKAGKLALCEEIKNRAKGSLASKNYREAGLLYSKAIEVMAGQGEDAYLSILHANRSMCELGMGKGFEAEADAALSLRLDPTYVKAYYRRGAALCKLARWEEARDVLQQGLERKPEDKEMQAQLDKVLFSLSNPDSTPKPQHAATAAAAATSAAAAVPKARSTISTSAGTSSSTKPVDTRAKATSASISRPARPEEPEAEADGEEDGTKYRGYKMTSDGRKTTFFNNELDSQTKELIGDIAPKKLVPAGGAGAAPVLEGAAPTQGSAWNMAGTFESKDLSGWARDRLSDMLRGVEAALPGGEAVVKVTEATVTGDGEVVAARGKRKHIYDFTASIKWSAAFMNSEQGPALVTGSLTVNDIDADEDSGYEAAGYAVTGSPTPQQLAVLNANVRSSSTGLQPRLFAQMDAFRREFKER